MTTDIEPKVHREAPGPTGWETLCGRFSASLTRHDDEVDCKRCLRKMETNHDD